MNLISKLFFDLNTTVNWLLLKGSSAALSSSLKSAMHKAIMQSNTY